MSTEASPTRSRTPATGDGPLYPPEPIPRRADLTNGGLARGTQLILFGRIGDHTNRTVFEAVVEIWQADDNGYYDHPRARGEDALDSSWKISSQDLDPNFSYFGSTETNARGVYWFKTIVPGWYHVFGTDRAPHIHLKMRHRDHDVLTTQIYFSDPEHEQVRSRDRIYRSLGQGPELIVDTDSVPRDPLVGVPSEPLARYCRRDLFFR